VSTQRNQLAEKVKDLEVRRTTAEASARGIYELQFQQAKLDLEQATAADQERSARQAELASELNQARSGMADARSRIAELERALDAAIQQLVKQK
jgi:chromosome segregation ATPase